MRVGDDGDTCFLGFADTTLLDLVSRVGPKNISRHGKLANCFFLELNV